MNNKDLIEDIIAKLKDAQELPYREGAWEKYAAQQGQVAAPKIVLFRRLASIAAVALAVLGVSLYLFNSQNIDLPIDKSLVQSTTKTISENPKSTLTDKNQRTASNSQFSALEDGSNAVETIVPNVQIASKVGGIASVEGVVESDLLNIDYSQNSFAQLNTIKPTILPYKTTVSDINIPTVLQPSIHTLAHQSVNAGLNKDVDNLKQSTKMSLGDKFQLGLYVSPNRTSDQFDIGAGFLVSYALTKKISVRTGTSYNSYSVGVVKDPLEMASAELLDMDAAQNNSVIVENAYAAKQQMILPNVNAVMGKVEAIEIPLDVTYNFNKGFYSSAGVSYSAIIKQEREAQYIENGAVMSLQDNALFVPNAVQGMSQVQKRTVKSSQDNVNPKGFSGFANFSLGKKVNINKKMSLSVEPFVKVPLGEFRKSDLDYTNSGIRIITSF